jgi:tRNA pseudouridine32 synthase/23S rRNA pseudouridine746 synthase
MQMSDKFTLVDTQSDFLVINKNCNVDFHKGTNESGLCDLVRENLNITGLYPVHRLDSMTSGLLLFARNRAAASVLSSLFTEHSIEKYYCAIAGNKPRKKQGTIAGDMEPLRSGMWKLTHSTVKPAVTHFFSCGLGNGFRLYIIKIRTGRTHQNRVALKSLGVPVLGDNLYGKDKMYGVQPDRPYLHSYAMRFTYNDRVFSYCSLPASGNYFTEKSTIAVLKQYSAPWDLQWPKNPCSRPAIFPH